MSKIIKFEQSVSYYYDKATQLSEKGEYLACLDFIHKGLNRYPDDLTLQLLLAETYLEMNLYRQALKQYFYIMADYEGVDEVYLGIVQCYMHLDMISQAFLLLKRGIDDGLLDDQDGIDDVIRELVEEENRPPLYVIDKKSCNADMLQFAKHLMWSGDNQYSKQMFEGIAKDSEQYLEACCNLALIYVGEKNGEKSLEYTNIVLEQDNENVSALNSRIMALNILDRIDERDATIEYLDSLEIVGANNLSKAVVTFEQIKDRSRTLKYLELLYDEIYYDRDVSLNFGLANANCGKISKARDILLKILKLDPKDTVVQYYLQGLADSVEGIKTNFQIFTELPKEEAEKRINEIEDFLSEKKSIKVVEKELQIDEYMRNNIYWLFQSDLYNEQGNVGAFLVQSEKWQPFFKKLLVDPEFNYRPKKECLQSYLQCSRIKSFSLVLTDSIISFEPQIPKIISNLIVQFSDAYWMVYATLAFVDFDFDKKLNTTFKKIVKNIHEYAIGTEFKPKINVLSAVIAYCSKINKIFLKKEDCCEVFECDLTDFESYLSAAEGKLKKI